MRNPSNALYPYRIEILRENWHPGVQTWMRENAGVGNFRYIKHKDAYTYLRYGFKDEQVALMFKIMFGGL